MIGLFKPGPNLGTPFDPTQQRQYLRGRRNHVAPS